MKIYFYSHFEKKFKKLDSAVRIKFLSRLKLFSRNPFHPQLRNHALKGSFTGYRSINVTGDYRAVYKQVAENAVEFQTIDTHSNLYS